jgi:acetyl-CoA C-acetyltransferase
VNLAASQVATGHHDLVVAGGVESMSRVGIGASGGAWPVDPEIAVPAYFMPQGVSADLIATKFGISRDECDAYAVESQRRTARAWEEGRFARSVVPVRDINGLTLLARDEHPRPGTDMQALGALSPSFEIVGAMGGFDAVAVQAHPDVEKVKHVHVGNKRGGKAAGLTPRAKVRAFANIGSDPALMLTGPVDVTRKLLRRAKMQLADIDLVEINEAFASVVIHYERTLGLDPEKVNVNGGAIAMGHPLGATGAMILGTALDELERRDLSTALVTLCIGAGMGTATVIERV